MTKLAGARVGQDGRFGQTSGKADQDDRLLALISRECQL